MENGGNEPEPFLVQNAMNWCHQIKVYHIPGKYRPLQTIGIEGLLYRTMNHTMIFNNTI
jgi:hypothetical protein